VRQDRQSRCVHSQVVCHSFSGIAFSLQPVTSKNGGKKGARDADLSRLGLNGLRRRSLLRLLLRLLEDLCLFLSSLLLPSLLSLSLSLPSSLLALLLFLSLSHRGEGLQNSPRHAGLKNAGIQPGSQLSHTQCTPPRNDIPKLHSERCIHAIPQAPHTHILGFFEPFLCWWSNNMMHTSRAVICASISSCSPWEGRLHSFGHAREKRHRHGKMG